MAFITNLSLMEFWVRYLALFCLFSIIDGFGWFWIGSLFKNIQLMLELFKAPFLVLHFSYYNDLADNVICNLPSGILSVATTRVGCLSWIWSLRHCELGQEMICCFQSWENSTCLLDRSKNTGPIDGRMERSVFEKKSSLKMLEMPFSSKLDWGFKIISIAKTASKKIEALIRSVKFRSINLQNSLAWNTVIISGLVLLVATWNDR